VKPAFCESDEILEMAASMCHHWTAEIFTVKMISSTRLKLHWTRWSWYNLLSPSVRRDEGGLPEPGIQQDYTTVYEITGYHRRDLVA